MITRNNHVYIKNRMEVYELESMDNLLYVYMKGNYLILEHIIAFSKSHIFPDFQYCVYLLAI